MESNLRINLKKDRPIINLLGEICWGFPIANFEKTIGVKKETAEALLSRLLKEEKAGLIESSLSDSETEIIRKALQEVEKEIEEWEFQTRLGVSLNEVKKMPIFKGTIR